MKYQFEIKDKHDSQKHQEHFFKLGCGWRGHGKDIRHLDGKYLFVDTLRKTITWSSTSKADEPNDYSETYIKSKLLHPKQKDFLQKLSDRGLTTVAVDSILLYGFYKEDDSDYLNDLRR